MDLNFYYLISINHKRIRHENYNNLNLNLIPNPISNFNAIGELKETRVDLNRLLSANTINTTRGSGKKDRDASRVARAEEKLNDTCKMLFKCNVCLKLYIRSN